MINIYYGGSGTGKSTALKKIIKNEAENNSEIISLIPEQYSFVYENSIYDMLGAEKFSKISCESFKSMTRNILKKYGTGVLGLEYASDISKYIILCKSIDNVYSSLVYYKRKAKQNDFLADIFKLINNFRKSEIMPDLFYEKLGNSEDDLGLKARDISIIYGEYMSEMEKLNKKDLTTDLAEAAKIASSNGYFDNKIIFMDEYESFSQDQYSVIEKMVASCKDFYIAIRTQNPFEKNDNLFVSGNITFNKIKDLANKYNKEIKIKKFDVDFRFQKNTSLSNLSKYCFKSRILDNRESNNIKIFEAENIYSEADYIAASIKHLIIEKKCHYGDIAVLTNNLSTYGMHLESAFKRYDIPYNLSIRKSTAYMPLMQYISALFEMITLKTPSTEAILRYIKTGLYNTGNFNISKYLPSLEKYIYTWNIRGEQWFEPFPFEDNDKDSERAEKIREIIISPISKLITDCKKAETYKDICSCLVNFMENQEIDIKLSNKDFGNDKVNSSMELIWNSFIEIINSVVETMGNEKADLKEFCKIFLVSAERIEFDMPPMMLDSVEIADAKTARTYEPKYVFIPGVNEDVFPLIEDEKSLFTDIEKKKISEKNIELFYSQQHINADSCLAAYKAISCASEGICFTYAMSGIDGQKMYPSDIVTRIGNIFTKSNDLKIKYSDIPAEFYAITYEGAYYHYILLGNENSKDKKVLEEFLRTSEEYSAKIDYLKNISEIPDFKIKDKTRLKKVLGDKIYVSPTSIEDYEKCPFIYFCKRVLKVYKPMQKDINPIEKGNVIHYILEKTLSEVSKDELIHLSDESLKEYSQKYGKEYFDVALKGGISVLPRMKTAFTKIVDDSQNVLKHLKNEFEKSSFVPTQFEFPIGQNSDTKLEFTLSNGCIMSVNGKIDRIDTAELSDGRKAVRVVDYKTGKHIFSRQKIYDGFDCQMFLYLFSVTENDNIYSDYIPAGVLYMPSGTIPNRTESSSNYERNIDDYINSTFGMSGIVLNDPIIINSMEKDSKAVFIPVSIDGKTRKGDNDSLLLSENQMKILKDYINKIMISAGDNIYNGEFNCMPYISSERTTCDNCDYSEICRVAAYKDEISRIENKIQKKDFMDLISKSLNTEKGED
ncbi:MAG: PD-(D/E)XK nuclease family protein [Ruminococcus callidus]|nr:PD-(D/E)XK nuclease family protein [Ruminococcus callidus]